VPRDLKPYEPGDGPLGRVNAELDEHYYGIAAGNRRTALLFSVDVLFAAFRELGLMARGPATPSSEDDWETLQRPQPRYQDTTSWIRFMHLIEDPVSLASPAGPDPERPTSPFAWELATIWRLDVLLALSALPPSRQRVFRWYADGLGWDEEQQRKRLEEIGAMGEDISAPESIRARIKEASSQVRRRTELNVPGRSEPKRQPRPAEPLLCPNGAIQRVEREFAEARLRSQGST
jgi:hypothetical protein